MTNEDNHLDNIFYVRYFTSLSFLFHLSVNTINNRGSKWPQMYLNKTKDRISTVLYKRHEKASNNTPMRSPYTAFLLTFITSEHCDLTIRSNNLRESSFPKDWHWLLKYVYSPCFISSVARYCFFNELFIEYRYCTASSWCLYIQSQKF